MDIGSAAFLGLLCVVSVLIYALEPVDKPILTKLALIPDEVTSGQVWRVFTWPLANGLDQQLLWVHHLDRRAVVLRLAGSKSRSAAPGSPGSW